MNARVHFFETKDLENKSLRAEVHFLKTTNNRVKKSNINLQSSLDKLEAVKFSYKSISEDPTKFKYFCGLTVEKFDMLFEIVKPFLSAIKYPDCKGSTTHRSVNKETELFAFMALCRHSLHLGVIGHMMNVSISTVDRIFVGLDGLCSWKRFFVK